MKMLNVDVLAIGDIVLSTTLTKTSKALRVGTRSDISHAMLYVQDHSLIDSTSEGVQSRNTQRVIIDDECKVYVLRLFGGLSGAQAGAVVTFARAQIGTSYSVREAVQTGMGIRGAPSRKQFCSRLVAQAYAAAGINLVRDPNYCTPQQLLESKILEEVSPTTIPVTAEYVTKINAIVDVTKLTTDATNFILRGAKIRNQKIESLNDVIQHLQLHPEDDEYIERL